MANFSPLGVNFSILACWTQDRCRRLQNAVCSRNFRTRFRQTLNFLLYHAALRKGDGLDINVRKRSQVQVIQLRGPLRMGPAVDSLRQTLEEALGTGDTRVVMNLSEVPMVDSTGIGLLVRFLTLIKQKGGNLKLAQPSKFAVQTLRLVGVLNLFEVFDNDDAAVESFT